MRYSVRSHQSRKYFCILRHRAVRIVRYVFRVVYCSFHVVTSCVVCACRVLPRQALVCLPFDVGVQPDNNRVSFDHRRSLLVATTARHHQRFTAFANLRLLQFNRDYQVFAVNFCRHCFDLVRASGLVSAGSLPADWGMPPSFGLTPSLLLSRLRD